MLPPKVSMVAHSYLWLLELSVLTFGNFDAACSADDDDEDADSDAGSDAEEDADEIMTDGST